MKTCFKCGEEKPPSAFYKDRRMSDGHLGKCKSCTKKDASQYRAKNIDRIRAYDRARGSRLTLEYQTEYRKRFPEKARARRMVAYHTNKGNMTKKPCEICGETKVHGHHDDYSKPLDVRWLCAAHHKQWHMENPNEPS